MSEIRNSHTFDGTPYSESWGPPGQVYGAIDLRHPSVYFIPDNLRLRIRLTGNITINIYAYEYSYTPVGNSLASGSADVDTSGAFADVDIALSSSESLQTGTTYLILFSVNADLNIACDDVDSNLHGRLFRKVGSDYITVDPPRFAWFEIEGSPGILPEPARNVSPIAETFFEPSDTILLQWNDGGGDYPATKYGWYISAYDENWEYQGVLGGTVNAPTTEKDATASVEYFYDTYGYENFSWKIRAKNANGSQEAVDDWNFINSLQFTEVSPEDEAEDVANDATLSWKDSRGSDYWKIYFGSNLSDVTNKSLNVYRGDVYSPSYDPLMDLLYGVTYYWLITAVKDGVSDSDSDVYEFTIISEAAGMPDAKNFKKKICSAANDKFFYDNDDSPPKQIELSGLTLDTSKAITMFELDQKVFIANDTILKVVDFANTKLTLNSAMTVPPRRGYEITQANSGAKMIVDYVAKGELTVIYGRTISGTFTEDIAITLAENVGGTSVKFTAAGHPFQVDDIVQITGTTDYNGTHTVTVIDGDTFTVVVTWVDNQQGVVGSGLSGDTMSPTTRYPTTIALPTIPHHYTWGVYADVTETDEFGAMPTRATIGDRWRGRACLTGNPIDPHQWYQSRQMNPYDMFYGEDDEQSAVAGTNAKASKVGDIVTASIPYSDDYKLYGSIGDIWVLRGDPAAGGNLDKLIEGIGIISQLAWCWDDADNLYILDLKGIYKITRDLASIEPMTSDKIPNFTKDLALNPETQRIVLSFDPAKQGIVISVTTIETGANVNYFYDLQSEGFSPETYPVQDAIMCNYYYDADDSEQRRLLFGSYDGHMRILDPAKKSDDIGSIASPASAAIESYVLLGPVLIGGNHNFKGRMNSLTVVTAGGKAGGTVPDSDDVAYAVFVGDDAETVMEKVDADTPIFGGVISAPGRAKRIRRRARGVFLAVRLGNVATYVVTGTLNPAATGNYLYAGTYRGEPYYRREDGAYFIWWYPTSSYWIISAAVGVLGAAYWYKTSSEAGEYTAAGTATGTPTAAASTEGKTWGMERVLAEILPAGRAK